MRPSHILLLLALLVVCHHSIAAIFDPDNLNCRCRRVTSTFIHPSKYESIKITLPGINCRRTEIIITLKTKRTVCLNPEAKWVKTLLAVLKRNFSSQTTNGSFEQQKIIKV